MPQTLDKRGIMYYLCIVFFMVLDLRLEDSCRETIIPFFYQLKISLSMSSDFSRSQPGKWQP